MVENRESLRVDPGTIARLDGEPLVSEEVLASMVNLIGSQREFDETASSYGSRLSEIGVRLQELTDEKDRLESEAYREKIQKSIGVNDFSSAVAQGVFTEQEGLNPIYGAVLKSFLDTGGSLWHHETLAALDELGRGLSDLDRVLKNSHTAKPMVGINFVRDSRQAIREVIFGMTRPEHGLELHGSGPNNTFLCAHGEHGHVHPMLGISVEDDTLQRVSKGNIYVARAIPDYSYVSSDGRKFSIQEGVRKEQTADTRSMRYPQAMTISLPMGKNIVEGQVVDIALYENEGDESVRVARGPKPPERGYYDVQLFAIGERAIVKALTDTQQLIRDHEAEDPPIVEIVVDMLDFVAGSLGIALPVLSKK